MFFNKNIAEDDVLIEIVNSLGLRVKEIVKGLIQLTLKNF